MASWAYDFICDLRLAGLHARLNELGPPDWVEGDSAWYGDYLGCKALPGVRWRIHDFGHRAGEAFVYNADVRLDSECRMPRAAIDAAFRELFARVPMRDLREIDAYD